MSTQKYVQQFEITVDEFNQKCVEFRFGKWIFKIDLDEHGNPLFPDSLKHELPTYMPQMVEEIVKRMTNGQAGAYYQLALDPEHDDWCAEVKGTGKCNCWPTFRDNNQREYFKTWTCAVCGISTTGRAGCTSGFECSFNFWVYKDNDRPVRAYWQFDCDKPGRTICDDCVDRDIVHKIAHEKAKCWELYERLLGDPYKDEPTCSNQN
jgi:hypothetical protein